MKLIKAKENQIQTQCKNDRESFTVVTQVLGMKTARSTTLSCCRNDDAHTLIRFSNF